jgi:hypothetical protein
MTSSTPFVQKWSGEGRDHQGREEEDGDGLVELEISERNEIEAGGHNHEAGAEPLHQRLGGTERGGQRKRPQHRRAKHHVSGESQPSDFGDGNAFLDHEKFRRRVERGEAERGERHQPDRFQSSARMDVGEGEAARRHEAGCCCMNLCQNAISPLGLSHVDRGVHQGRRAWPKFAPCAP